VLRRYQDGSALSRMGATQVRLIDAQITITTAPTGAPGTTGWSPPYSTRAATPQAS
jgi:hypothetical protein